MSFDFKAIARRAAGRARAARGLGGGEPDGGRPGGIHVTLGPCDESDRPAGRAARDAVERSPESGTGESGAGEGGSCEGPGTPLVTANCLGKVADGGVFELPAGSLVTPLCREEAHRRRISLVGGRGLSQLPVGGAASLRVAVGSDHGGFAMKEQVKEWLAELGHRALDQGTFDQTAVDYPDYARKVGEAVANGNCHFGVCIDGAGLGSTMAANRVPGILAANCWDERTAHNAREHNYANVLVLGTGGLDDEGARRVLSTFLSTPSGAARHGRRVDKILAMDRPG
ncbi:MAG: RpiB/LacA/LacB family sugar-phosphate isomerase [Planctomycetota bacterium]|nr:RpiB/LacA/LacB family sugar-phosphate isomerase [Planctomycetota bacterium]